MSAPRPVKRTATALVFAPDLADDDIVPVRARRDGWTAARQRAFLERLAETGSVVEAAAAVRMSARSAYRLRRMPHAQAFARAWDSAMGQVLDLLLDTALQRALHGTTREVRWQGEVVGVEQLHSDRLITFMIANGKKLYKDREQPAAFTGELDLVAAGGFSVWRKYDCQWWTNYPPPPGAAVETRGRVGCPGYERRLTDAEVAVMDAREAAGVRVESDPALMVAAQAARQAYFGTIPQARIGRATRG